MITSFLPALDAQRVSWLNHFANRIAEYGPQFDMDEEAIQSVQDDADMFAYIVQLQDAARQYWISVSNLKKLLRHSAQQTMQQPLPPVINLGSEPVMVNNGIFDRLAVLATQIRLHSAYTTAIGQDLGIVPPATPAFNPNTLAPDLSIKLQAGYPLLKWKKGDTDGVHIYVDRHDGNGFVLLARTVKNQYIDSHALPPSTFSATWDYKIRYLIGDDEVGSFSPVISINVLRAAS